MKAQSAMEYLMTYGWAILIIAIVLGALFELGIFSADTFAPRAQAGACYAFRPKGTGTTFDLSLAGVCNGAIPQYVAKVTSGSAVNVGTSNLLQITGDITISIWVASNQSVYGSGCSPTASMLFGQWISGSQNNNALFWADACTGLAPEIISDGGRTGATMVNPNTYSNGKWHMVTGVRQGTSLYMYVDGVQIAGPATAGAISNAADAWYIGSGPSWSFYGYVSNAQIYNTSLSSARITELYDEGIGGPPVDLNHLVGWWPLNGDMFDYSGNSFNGNSIGTVTYTSHWTSVYKAP